MRAKSFIPLLFVALITYTCNKEQSPLEPQEEQTQIFTSEEKAILNELGLYVTPCTSALPNADPSELKVLDELANARILGLGEATHGTKEFFQMKHRIFKYMVEKHGFKIFGFEADMGECIYIDRFICNNEGTIDGVMNKMHFWTWKTQEVKELILWMRDYNRNKAPADKIHLLGVDCQAKTYNKDLILEYLGRFDSSYPQYLVLILYEINAMDFTAIKTYSYDQVNQLKTRCDSVINYFSENRDRLIARSGEFEYNLIQRLTLQTKQIIDVYASTGYNYRDKYMAENSVWLSNSIMGETKVVLWAHNGHVGKSFSSEVYGGSQGYHISQLVGNLYKVIGFSFCTGNLRAFGYNMTTGSYTGLMNHVITGEPLRESTNFMFYYTVPSSFILVIDRTKSSNLLYGWLNTSRKFLSIGAVFSINNYSNYFVNYNLSNTFDALIHFRTTWSSTPI
jgi:erythromycin esterase